MRTLAYALSSPLLGASEELRRRVQFHEIMRDSGDVEREYGFPALVKPRPLHFFTFRLFRIRAHALSAHCPRTTMASKQSLSDCCRVHGLPVTGNKDELLERLLGEKHILKAVLATKPVKKEKDKKTSPLLKKTIGKKDAYEQFCDKNRHLLIAGGMTDSAQISRKLAEMFGNKSSAKKPVAITSHGDNVSQMPPDVRCAMGFAQQQAAPPIRVGPPAPRGLTIDPVTIPDNMVVYSTKIPDQYVALSGLHLVSEGFMPSGQTAWLYLKKGVGSSSAVASHPVASAMPAAPPSTGLYAQSESTLRASLMALGLSTQGDKHALVDRIMRGSAM